MAKFFWALIFVDQHCLWTKLLFTQLFFVPKICLYPKSFTFLTKIFNRPRKMLYQNFFSLIESLFSLIILGQIFLYPIFVFQKYLWIKIILALIFWTLLILNKNINNNNNNTHVQTRKKIFLSGNRDLDSEMSGQFIWPNLQDKGLSE